MDMLEAMLVDVVKRFARANGDMDGWDVIALYSDTQILDLIGTGSTSAAAIRNVGRRAISAIRSKGSSDTSYADHCASQEEYYKEAHDARKGQQ